MGSTVFELFVYERMSFEAIEILSSEQHYQSEQIEV